MFEDSEQGLRAALAAGMQCIVIEGTAPAERLDRRSGYRRGLGLVYTTDQGAAR